MTILVKKFLSSLLFFDLWRPQLAKPCRQRQTNENMPFLCRHVVSILELDCWGHLFFNVYHMGCQNCKFSNSTYFGPNISNVTNRKSKKLILFFNYICSVVMLLSHTKITGLTIFLCSITKKKWRRITHVIKITSLRVIVQITEARVICFSSSAVGESWIFVKTTREAHIHTYSLSLSLTHTHTHTLYYCTLKCVCHVFGSSLPNFYCSSLSLFWTCQIILSEYMLHIFQSFSFTVMDFQYLKHRPESHHGVVKTLSLTCSNWFNTIHNLHRWKKFPTTFARTFQTCVG